MESDDQDKSGLQIGDSEVTSGSNGGRMSITEEEALNEASDGLESEEDDSNDDEDLSDDSNDEEDYDIYYGGLNEDLDDGRSGINVGPGSQFNNNDDPEYFGYECLTVAQIKDLLSESIAQVCATIQVRI